jgi:ribosomal protein S18 acetylase RimI-like enzyme
MIARLEQATPIRALDLAPVQPATAAEREQIRQVAREAGVFNSIELDTVDELLDGYYADADASGYHFLSYRDADRVLGFAAWGPRSLTERGYDLYWIATRPEAQRRGVARALLEAVETLVRGRGGGWIVIETSNTPPYAAARGLYERCGYARALFLPDFYRAGDGLTVFAKQVG